MKMPDPIQVEQTVPAGSGDPDFDAALLEAGTPPAEKDAPPADAPPTDAPPAEDPDFTFATLENGQREMRLATGQVYRGKDDAELYGQLAKAQVAASKRITELSARPEPVAPIAPTPVTPEAVDPTALAIADLMAPAFGVKNGAELVAAFAEQQRIANAQQEFMGAQQANMEAANFFRAVPEFSKSQADADKIDQFLQTNNMPFNANTAEMAYYTLKAKGEMTAAPTTTRAAAPKNGMPPPPAGTAPANTGKGAPTEADLWSMSADELAELLTSASPQ
jgi:hypothetical protein